MVRLIACWSAGVLAVVLGTALFAEASEEVEEHPWGSFSIGSYIEFETTQNAGRREKVRVTIKEVNETEVVVLEERGDNENERRIPLEKEQPAGEVVEKTREKVKVDGTVFDCEVIRARSKQGRKEVVRTVWKSEKAPGGIVKEVREIKGMVVWTTKLVQKRKLRVGGREVECWVEEYTADFENDAQDHGATRWKSKEVPGFEVKITSWFGSKDQKRPLMTVVDFEAK